MSELPYTQSNRTVTTFGRFFAEQAEGAESARRQTVGLAIALAVVLGVLLFVLGSAPIVWVYIGLLYVVVWSGIWRLNETLAATAESARHLGRISDLVVGDPTREQFIAAVREMVSPHDRSNVPEAVEAMCQAPASAENARVAAHTAFAKPLAELDKAIFLRMTLVLAGLFGTVLFFALELRPGTFAGGNLDPLLQGLRGALASTLTGIAGSVTIGVIASRISGRLHQLIGEAETLFIIAVGGILGRRHTREAARSEADLWEALQAEVEALADRVQQQSQKMADDTHAYTLALQAVSQQLRELPEVRVPQELGQLNDVVGRFTDGANLLGRAIPLLVEAVGAVGGIIPAKLLQDVAGMRGEVNAGLDGVQSSVGGLIQQVQRMGDEVRQTMEPVPDLVQRLDESTAGVESAARRVDASASRIHGAAAEIARTVSGISHDIRRMDNNVGALSEDVNELNMVVRDARGDVEKLREDLGDLPSKDGRPGLLKQVQNQILKLDEIVRWHERVGHAPLMRLLSAPLWNSWRRRRAPGPSHDGTVS